MNLVLSLTDREWSAFLLTDVFVIKAGKRLTKSDMRTGKRPFIGATEYGNGITNWVSNSNVSLDCNLLGVNYNGSVVETFYHPYECIFSDDVKRFKLKDREGNRRVYLFLRTTIIQQKSKYAYGYKFNEERMNKQSILLPIDEVGNPDWAFMEEYIREREGMLIAEYRKRLADIPTLENLNLTDREWSVFSVDSLFDVYTGSLIEKAALKIGNHPRVTVKETTNGIDGFYDHSDDRNYRTMENFISVSFLGGVFYHPYKASLDMKVHTLKLKDKEFNRPLALFLVRVMRHQTLKFSYGDQLSSTDLAKQKILLPVDEAGAPDWAFMEDYVSMIRGRQIRAYLEYLERRDM